MAGSDRREPCHDLVEQLGDARAMLRGDFEHRIEPELKKFERRFLRSLVVGLVDGEDHRPAGLAQLAGDAFVAGHEPFASVDQEHEQVGADHRAFALLDDELVERVLAGAEEPAGVEERELGACPGDGPPQRIARRSGDRRHDRAAAAGHPVEQRGFAHVRPPNEDDR